MESWGYTFVGKDFISDDSTSGNNEIPRNHSKNGLMGCELKSPWSYGTTMVSSTQEVVENQPFSDLNSSEMMRISDILAPTNDFSLENQSSSRDSSSLIDLKLGRLNDYRDSKNLAESSMTVKRARGGAYSSHIPYCQVHGCKKDLSSSKDYHKRHKVCEIHSKTSQVIVNGIEQRFCQQCSRFHLLSEFDDGKRSCRKRLAGHNERRRKPHMRIHSDKSGKLFQSINATSFKGNTSYDSSRIMKIEDGVDRFTSGPLFGSRDLGKQSTSIHDEGISVITRNNMYVHEIDDSDYMSRSILHHSSGNSDMRVSESHSNRALSLLSSSSTTSLPVITSGSRANALFSFRSMMNNHVDENHLNYQPILNGMIEESEYINRKNEDDPTINLLDLSSQMQRVEHQRQTMLMKMENDAFSDLKIT